MYMLGRIKGVEQLVVLILVYAPNTVRERRSLWEELLNMKNSVNLSVVAFGDFNEVTHSGERSSERANSVRMQDFNQWLQEMKLLKVPMLGRKYIWRNGRQAS
ncbi:hypothetical protein S245_009572 [Arachis hypogaea]